MQELKEEKATSAVNTLRWINSWRKSRLQITVDIQLYDNYERVTINDDTVTILAKLRFPAARARLVS